jgi:hypothetical protein
VMLLETAFSSAFLSESVNWIDICAGITGIPLR